MPAKNWISIFPAYACNLNKVAKSLHFVIFLTFHFHFLFSQIVFLDFLIHYFDVGINAVLIPFGV